jgi:hypothetical protein
MVTKSVGVCGGLSSCSGGTGDGVLRCGLCDAGVVCRLLASESREETWLPGGGSSRGGSCASAGHCVSRAVYLFCVIDCLFQGFVVKRMGKHVKMKLNILPFIYCLCSQSHTPMKTDVGLDVVVRSEHRRNLEDVRAFAYLCLSVPVDMGQGKTSCSTKSGSCDVPRSTESWNVKETDGLRIVYTWSRWRKRLSTLNTHRRYRYSQSSNLVRSSPPNKQHARHLSEAGWHHHICLRHWYGFEIDTTLAA